MLNFVRRVLRMLNKVKDFIGTTNFTNALKVTLAAVIPVLTFNYLGDFQTGFTIALGALLTYPSDIPSNVKHKMRGVFVAALIVAGSNLLINFLYSQPYIFYPVFAALLFFLSMISVYGQRATMVSFSGLLAASLAFAHIDSGWKMIEHSGLMLVGGLFYLLISLVFDAVSPHHYVRLQIAECTRLTAKYMKLRGDLWNPDAYRDKIIEKQLHLQVELNTIHENLREILIRNRSDSGNSNHGSRMLLAFISCLEILELALSTSFDHSKLHEKFREHPKVLATYQHLAYNLGATLKRLSKSIGSKTRYTSGHSLFSDLDSLEKVILEYKTNSNPQDADGALMLYNMMHYAQKQIEKIKVIERLFGPNPDLKELKGRDRDLDKFVAPNHYSFQTLRENLSFSSGIFRHSLRLTVVMMIGFVVGNAFIFQNSYWILLTIIVILRPGYGLTRQRSLDRVIGTIAGGLIAFGMLFFIKDAVAIGTLAIFSMLLGFSFTQINYRIGATFVTMYVVLLYGIMMPGSSQVVEFRILDTAVGAALAFVANYLLWPAWEFLSLPAYISKSIKANRDYLNEISIFYNAKGDVTSSYRLSRKNAFIEIGNLMASFQRMAQEPKSKQKQLPQVYKIVELNHSLLSASASLGSYIQTHHTSKASKAFNVVANSVIRNLDEAIHTLDPKTAEPLENNNEDIPMRFIELKNIRAEELKDDADFELKMQEAQLVIEQLVWLIGLSEGILKATKKFDQYHNDNP